MAPNAEKNSPVDKLLTDLMNRYISSGIETAIKIVEQHRAALEVGKPRTLKFIIMEIEEFSESEYKIGVQLLPEGAPPIHLGHRFRCRKMARTTTEKMIRALGATPECTEGANEWTPEKPTWMN